MQHTRGVADKLLLCELHAHTTWSDGELTLEELVDLYGRSGFDVLCVTDHAVPTNDPRPLAIDSWTWPAYLAAVDREAERARREYDLLVIPGLELTDDHDDPARSAHALSLGLRRFVSLDYGLEAALEDARAQGAVTVAAHPYTPRDHGMSRATTRFWHDYEELARLIDRYELFNRDQVFGWIADRDLPPIASGDFHDTDDLSSWKTLLLCEKDEAAVLALLGSRERVYLAPHVRDTVGVRLAA